MSDYGEWVPRQTPSQKRKVIGVVITIVVLVAAYIPTRFFGGHSTNSLLGSYLGPNTSCSSYKYPAGAHYTFEGCSGGQPLRWTRCSNLAVAVDTTNAPPGWYTDTTNALGQLARATGLRFRVTTNSADIAISWDRTLSLRGGGHPDKAGLTSLSMQSGLTNVTLRSADIQISSMLSSGSGLSGEVPVLLHELGHAVGLGHYQGPEVMNPVDQGYSTFQTGDLAGLTALYDPVACQT